MWRILSTVKNNIVFPVPVVWHCASSIYSLNTTVRRWIPLSSILLLKVYFLTSSWHLSKIAFLNGLSCYHHETTVKIFLYHTVWCYFKQFCASVKFSSDTHKFMTNSAVNLLFSWQCKNLVRKVLSVQATTVLCDDFGSVAYKHLTVNSFFFIQSNIFYTAPQIIWELLEI